MHKFEGQAIATTHTRTHSDIRTKKTVGSSRRAFVNTSHYAPSIHKYIREKTEKNVHMAFLRKNGRTSFTMPMRIPLLPVTIGDGES